MQQKEEVLTAVDKDVRQDHYHTSVQPVVANEVMPTQHHENIVAAETREFDHGAGHDVNAIRAREMAQFKDKKTIVQEQGGQEIAPVVAGEHIHHHVHETIQPVIQKEVIEPHVVHTVVPIHEVHHNKAEHHATSALPAVSMSDFQKQGGVLGGREERLDAFEGEPRALSGNNAASPHSATSTTGRETLGQRVEDKLDGRSNNNLSGSSGTGYNDGLTGGRTGGTDNTPIGSTGATHEKPGLMDKMKNIVNK